jgi:hypothetical protein
MSVVINDLIDSETGKIKTTYTNSGKPYGAFKSTSTQSGFTSNTTYIANSPTVTENGGITVVNSNEFKVPSSGTYAMQFSVQLKKTQGTVNKTIETWLKKNGTDISDTNTTITLFNNNRINITLFNFVVTLNEDDYIQLAFNVSDSNIILENTTGVPSVTFTIVQT